MGMIGSILVPSNVDDADAMCTRSVKVDNVQVMQYGFIPAVSIIIILSLLNRRRHLCIKVLDGRPGIPLPLDFLCVSNRIIYVAGFSVTAWILLDMIRAKDGENIFGIHTDHYSAGAVKFASCLLAGVLCYPILGCITSEHWLGYIMGTLYVWAFSAFYALTHYPCENRARFEERTDVAIGQFLDTMRFLPCALWLLFLCLYYPYRIGRVVLRTGRKSPFTQPKNRREFPYYVDHVRQMLDKPIEQDAASGFIVMFRRRNLLKRVLRKIYDPLPGFKYSVSMVTAVGVSLLLLYMLAIELISKYFGLVSIFKALINGFNNETVYGSIDREEWVFWLDIVTIVLFCSLAIAFSVNVAAMISTLKNHRRNLLNSYMGKFPFQVSLPKSARSIVVKSTRYIGYQFGYAVWGFVIQSIFILIFVGVIVCFCVVVIAYKKYDIPLEILKYVGPVLGYIVVLFYGQQVIVHLFFLRTDGNKRKTLAINNRSWFINYQYFMIFASSALGLMTCFIRILQSMLYGLWSLPRLDRSTLGRHYEKSDRGFMAYASFLKMESIYTNPTMLTFLYLTYQATRSGKLRKLAAKGQWLEPRLGKSIMFLQTLSEAVSLDEYKKRKAARNRWFLFLTLVNNPVLRRYRKNECRRWNGFGSSSTQVYLSVSSSTNCVQVSPTVAEDTTDGSYAHL